MKKLIRPVLSILVTFLILNACRKTNDTTHPADVQNITATPGYGLATFTWTFPDDSSYLYVSISYPDSTGRIIEQKYSKYSNTAEIEGLSAKPYSFTVTAINLSGIASSPETITVTPKDPVYAIVAPSLAISPGIGSATIKWNNPTGQAVVIKISYLDSTNTAQILSDSSSKAADSVIISSLLNVETSFTITLADPSGAHGADQLLKTTPLLESKIDKSNWSVTADSQETDGEGPVDGFATAAIDNDITTYWHTEWENAQPDYPHWLAVDMKQEVVLSRVELTPRQGKTDGFTSFDIDISNDGINWTAYASNLTLVQNHTAQSFAITSNPKVRYVRIYATAGVSYYANLAELSIYGSY